MKDALPVPVLMYHDLADRLDQVPAAHRPYVVSTDAFRGQMRLLKEATLGGTRLDAVLGPPPASVSRGRICVITFDDGHESNYTHALPLLQEVGLRATFFVTVGRIGQTPYMSWEQINALDSAGMEIGSHSMTHRPPASLTRSELYGEMDDSKRLLEDRLGRSVVSASSPTGFFNPQMVSVVRDIGYRALCIGRIALWKDPHDCFRIPRIPVKIQTGQEEFRRMLLGDPMLLLMLRGRQVVRNSLKAALGVEAYLRFRRTLLRLTGSRRPGSRAG